MCYTNRCKWEYRHGQFRGECRLPYNHLCPEEEKEEEKDKNSPAEILCCKCGRFLSKPGKQKKLFKNGLCYNCELANRRRE